MVEQAKSIDIRAREAKRIGRASDGVLEEVLSILDACIYRGPTLCGSRSPLGAQMMA